MGGYWVGAPALPLKKCVKRTNSECFRGNCGNNMATPIFTIWQQKGLIWQHCPMILYETLILQG